MIIGYPSRTIEVIPPLKDINKEWGNLPSDLAEKKKPCHRDR
jgi:hypothetical protein